MKARDVMTCHDLQATADTSDAREVAQAMANSHIGCLPVLDSEGRLEGLVTDRDICCRLVAQGRSFETPVGEIMTREVYSVSPEADLKDVEALMKEHKIRRVPVVDADNRLQGFIALADIASHIHRRKEQRDLASVVEAVSSPGGEHET